MRGARRNKAADSRPVISLQSGAREQPRPGVGLWPDWEQRRVEDTVLPYVTLSEQDLSLMVLVLKCIALYSCISFD